MKESAKQVVGKERKTFVCCLDCESQIVDKSLLCCHKEIVVWILTWNDVAYSFNWDYFDSVEFLERVVHVIILLNALIGINSHLIEFLVLLVQNSKSIRHRFILAILILVLITFLNIEFLIIFSFYFLLENVLVFFTA